jgi:hypothetical protein
MAPLVVVERAADAASAVDAVRAAHAMPTNGAVSTHGAVPASEAMPTHGAVPTSEAMPTHGAVPTSEAMPTAGSAALSACVADAESAGWRVLPGWQVPAGALDDVVLTGSVRSTGDAGAAMLAAVAGAGLIVLADADRDVIDLFCDDLRRVGTLDHRVGEDAGAALSADDRRLLELLAGGLTLGQAATRLHLSRRSADRRLASARAALEVATSGEAVIAYRERLDRIGRPVRKPARRS